MAVERSEISEREQRLGEIAFAYLEAREKGQAPDERDLLARHPEFANELAEFLADQANVDRLAAPLRPVALTGQAPSAVDAAAGVPNPLEDFRILREIGRGGMGVVYEAVQVSLGRRVALKVLPFAATMDSRQLQRFKNEAQAAAQLHHTNIVPVYYVGCERGVHFYAMQFIEGQTLAQVIADLRLQSADLKKEPETASRPLASPPDAAAVTGPYHPDPAGQSAMAATTPIAGIYTERSTRSQAYFRTVAKLGVQAAEALEHSSALCIATSSRPTCWWTGAATCGSPISGWPAARARPG